MAPNASKIRYFLYARKSSESEDRQVQSIEDQAKRLKTLAHELNLDVKRAFTEAKSAKKPNARPIFDDMIQRIENGEAEGILCWQINRLSRNPIDSARVQWLLQQGILKAIQTIDRQYLPDDNVLLFNVESGMANQFILDLRKNTKRGMDSKVEKGWMPNMAPLGYLNDKENKIIVKDPERFPLIRRMWDLMLTGNYTPPKILDMANDEWGFRTRKMKKIGGNPLSRSGIYSIFTNPFYAGLIKYNGTLFEGKHEKLITLEEYDHVQVLLGRNGKPRPKEREFAFTGLIRCGECGCLFTAETKTKFIRSKGEVRSYTYYHCTRRKRDVQCPQRKVVRVDHLEEQIAELLGQYTIMPEFRDWALEVIRESNDKEIEQRSAIYEAQHKALVETQRQLDALTRMRYRDLITDEEFTKERNLLQNQITQFKERLRETEGRAERWIELTEKTFEFATYARKAFLTGDLQTKKEILTALGQNPIIKSGKLDLLANEWFRRIGEDYPALEKEYLKLEPHKGRMSKAKTEALASVRTRWLPG